MPALRVVLFDFFGTLTEAVTRGPAHADLARRLGCDPTRFAHALDRTFPARSRGDLGPPGRALRTVARSLGVEVSRPAAEAVARARVAAVRDDTRLRAEAVPTLRALRAAGLRLGLVSDCGPELPAFLPELPVAALLDAAVFSIAEGVCKPHPAIYLAACDRLGVHPTECLYVGDGGSRELTGARALGMSAIQLVAPDRAGHLTFDVDHEFAGTQVTSLLAIPGHAAALTRRPHSTGQPSGRTR
jgi:putative hydrolase of the HAD superfamily